MSDFYGNDKNSQYNSSGVHSDADLDSNHNQLNDKSVIDLMVERDVAGQATVSLISLLWSELNSSCIFNFPIRPRQSSD